jgi:general secretion pathway protein L
MPFIDRFKVFGRLASGDAWGLERRYEQGRAALIGCLPARLRGVLAHRDRRVIIEPLGSTARFALQSGDALEPLGELALEVGGLVPEVGRDPHARPPERVLMMPPDLILTRTVSLPAQVRANLGQVVRYELDRLSPFQSSEVLFDFAARPAAKGAPRVQIDLALCRRDLADTWIKRLREVEMPIDRISWVDAWPGANLLPAGERPKRSLEILTPTRLLWAGVALVLLAILVGPLWQRHRIAATLEDLVQRARVEAIAVDDVRQELERARLGSTAVLQQKWDAPNILAMLNELSERIPDDTWIQTLDYNNGEVELRGESGQATALIGLLEQAPGIDEVAFRSPVTQIPQTGKERFNISLRFSRTTDE